MQSLWSGFPCSMAIVMKTQARWEVLDRNEVFSLGVLLIATGSLFVISSFLALGFTGTFLGKLNWFEMFRCHLISPICRKVIKYICLTFAGQLPCLNRRPLAHQPTFCDWYLKIGQIGNGEIQRAPLRNSTYCRVCRSNFDTGQNRTEQRTRGLVLCKPGAPPTELPERFGQTPFIKSWNTGGEIIHAVTAAPPQKNSMLPSNVFCKWLIIFCNFLILSTSQYLCPFH